MLWLMAYTFLLRLPSEALPACRASPEQTQYSQEQTLVWREADTVCIRMKRRKNRRMGSGTLRRGCTCASAEADFCKDMCPLHSLWERFFEKLPEGSHPWGAITPHMAMTRLRATLAELGVANPETYGTHDFRRGAAEASLHVISKRIALPFDI